MQQRGSRVTVVTQLAASHLGPLWNLVEVVKIDSPDPLTLLPGVPANQVTIGTEGVQVTGLRVIAGARRRARVKPFVSVTDTSVFRTSVRLLPDYLSSLCIQCINNILSGFPAHRVEAIADHDRAAAPGVNVRCPEWLVCWPIATLKMGRLRYVSVAVGPTPMRPVATEYRSRHPERYHCNLQREAWAKTIGHGGLLKKRGNKRLYNNLGQPNRHHKRVTPQHAPSSFILGKSAMILYTNDL